MLVHGLGGTGADIWKHQVPDLAAEFRVIAYDLRGSGRSEITPGPYTIDLLADDLRALVDALELGRVALVAHSMGGSIALAYAARYPADVRSLVGVGAPVGFPDQARAGLAARAEAVEAEGMIAVAETVATNGVSPTFREQKPEQFQELIAMIAANDPKGYAAQCRALVGLDLARRLGEIAAPVLLISGDRDGVSPAAVTEANAALVPDGRSALIEDCGHILTWEKPEALAGGAWPFLREHR
ncbi:MAG: alpha/beta hydrolase [Actinomycetota bacterium]|nr:alpha/beta hydrolase [Actinomycetota bacterium]